MDWAAAAIAHRLALSVWLGVFRAHFVDRRRNDWGRHEALRRAILRHFSRVATVAMLIILATGGILTGIWSAISRA